MPQDDYERYRKRLEEQLHADIGLLYDAFHAKLRAYQTMVRSRSGDLDLALDPPPASAGSPVPAPAPTTAPAPPEVPPESWSQPMIDILREVLPRLPEEFDKFDVIRALGIEPRRSTFYGALQQLRMEGVIDVAQGGGGKRAARYRRVAAAS